MPFLFFSSFSLCERGVLFHLGRTDKCFHVSAHVIFEYFLPMVIVFVATSNTFLPYTTVKIAGLLRNPTHCLYISRSGCHISKV